MKIYPEDILDARDAEHLRAMGSVATKLAAAFTKPRGLRYWRKVSPLITWSNFKGSLRKRISTSCLSDRNGTTQ
jgi:hypothetical protein